MKTTFFQTTKTISDFLVIFASLLIPFKNYAAVSHVVASHHVTSQADDLNQVGASSVANKHGSFLLRPTIYLPIFSLGAYQFDQAPHSGLLVNLLLPLFQDNNHLFYANGEILEQKSHSLLGSLGLGYRFIQDNHPDNLYGIYSGYDRVKSNSGYYFNQLSLGGEFWHQRLFLGADGYLPFGKTESPDDPDNMTAEVAGGTTKDNTPVNYILYSGAKEHALKGLDGKIGYNLWRGLSLYGGGYFFKNDGIDAISGPKAEISYVWYASQDQRVLGLFNRLSVDGEVSYDKAGNHWYAGITATVYLLKSQILTGIRRHMLDRPNRINNNIMRSISYSQPSYLKNPDGSLVTVAHPNNQSNNRIDHDVADPRVDIVAVDGTINRTDSLTINHNLVLTGGNYNFSVDGRQYHATLGHQGALQSSGNSNLITIQGDNTNSLINVTIENLLLTSVNPAYQAIVNQGGFGLLTIDHVISDGGVSIDLEDGQTGSIIFTNNQFHLPMLTDEQPSCLTFKATNDSSLDIINFVANDIEITSDSTGNDAYYLVDIDAGENAVIDVDNFVNNYIATSHPGDYQSVVNQTDKGHIHIDNFNNNIINIVGDNSAGVVSIANGGSISCDYFSNNRIMMEGTVNHGMNIIVSQNGAIIFNHINGNIINVGGEEQNIGIEFSVDYGSQGTITINDMTGNTINAGSGSLSSGISFYNLDQQGTIAINSSWQAFNANNTISSISGADEVRWLLT